MSTPPTSAAGVASMLRLPPSPETTTMRPDFGALPRHLSLSDADGTSSNHSRLRSIARYESFHPQAIACSTPLVTNFVHNEDPSSLQTPSRSVGGKKDAQLGSTSVAAIAGAQGVALFRISRPHTPLVVLSHASSRKSSTVSALAFQPHTKDSLLLAAARGNGVIIWDATGHSLSPLLGRLTMEPTLSSSDRITSISWKASSSQPMLATTNEMNACLWDLRTSLRANSSRPSLRLGPGRKINSDGTVNDPLIQIAASNKNELATMDASGTVSIFDIRMERTQGKVGEVSSFSSFHHAGIGLEYLPSCNADTRWIAWGLDARQTDAIVKVWSDHASSGKKDNHADSYWYMDSSPTTSPKTSMSKSIGSKAVQIEYQQVAEFSTPYLACARVCPEPFQNRVVTVGMMPGKSGIGTNGWQAESWKLLEPNDHSYTDEDHYGVEKIASFGIMLNDSEAASMVGTSATLGSLRGAELALETPRGDYRYRRDEEGGDAKGEGTDLLLCCLSEKGYVTAHTVFETLPPVPGSPLRKSLEDGQDPPKHGAPPDIPMTHAYSNITRMFQADGYHGRDAASMLRGTSDSEQVGVDANEMPFRPSDEFGIVSSQQNDLQYFGSGAFASNATSRPGDSTSTQFVMDVPIVSGMDVVEVASPPIVMLSNEENAIEIGLQRQNISSRRIDKDKVPCPRLCGASFSHGIGGIVCFNNGEVGKMWAWHEQADVRRACLPAEKERPTSLKQTNTTESITSDPIYEGGSSVFYSESTEHMTLQRRKDCPRTLQDLEDMTDHARFSQWRSDESSGEESSSDDESDESLDEFGSEDEGGEKHAEERKRMYEKYFGILHDNAVSSPSQQGEEKVESDTSISPPRSPSSRQKKNSDSSKSLAGGVGSNLAENPSSDLVPNVYISYDQDNLGFNGQSEHLARAWMLGEWYTLYEDEQIKAISPRSSTQRESAVRISSDLTGWGWDENALLPRPRSAEYCIPLKEGSQPKRDDDRMQRVRSDPILLKAAPASFKKYGVGSDEDPVHAGAYSKRPNRNESLLFLKKLVTHQRGDEQIQTLMSPPDSPLLPNKMSSSRKKRSSSPGAIVQPPPQASIVIEDSDLESTENNVNSLGVYILSGERGPPRRAKQREERLRDACLHNAEVSTNLGQTEKANVWHLLSQMAENVLEDEHDNFNGWGGAYGGSLGKELVSSFLQYYEMQGDVQMLATMVCVLGGNQRSKVAEGSSLLPVSHQDRYDSYIRQYADVLYAWKLMSKRAEVCKHLVKRLPVPSDDEQYAAVDIVVWCSRCHQEAVTDNGICRNCQNYAFRCSLCDVAVRGLFTVCSSCGHGGHTSHLAEWFNKHSVCPTGCGCDCVSIMSTQMGDVGVPEQPLFDEILEDAPELLIAGAGQIPLEGYKAAILETSPSRRD